MGFHNAARPAANSHAQRRVIACEKLRDERLAPEGIATDGFVKNIYWCKI